MDLREIVISKVKSLGGPSSAAEYFGVSKGLVSQWVTGVRQPPLHVAQRVIDEDNLLIPKPAPEKELWTGRDVCLLVPSYKTTNPMTMFCMVSTFDRARYRLEMYTNSDVVRARNELASRFLATDCRWSMWIDDDMVWPLGNAQWYKETIERPDLADQFCNFNAIERLISRGKTIIGGQYFSRTGRHLALHSAGLKAPHNFVGQSSNILPVEWVGGGFTLVHRSVYEDILKNEPELRGQRVHSMFNPVGAWGEDETFCRRAAKAGHQPWVDCSIALGHLGNKWWSSYPGGSAL